MIIEFAHTTLLVRDLDTAVAAYHRILGQKPDIRGTVEGRNLFARQRRAPARLPHGSGNTGPDGERSAQ